jgi:hypothetical protein
MQRDAWYKTWYMRGVSYVILMLQNSCSVGYLLLSLETFHSTTTEKSICLFMDVAIHEVALLFKFWIFSIVSLFLNHYGESPKFKK